MKRFLLFYLLISNITFADTLFGIYAGAQTWYYDYSGHLNADTSQIDFDSDFVSNREYNNSFFVAIEHPLPFVPNVKLKHTTLNKLGIQNTICPANFPNYCTYDASMDLSHTDLTLYYEILDNWVNLDLGLSAIYFAGDSAYDLQGNLPIRQNYTDIIPALYGKAMFELPITDLSVSVTANIGTLTSNTIFDMELAAQYQLTLGFSLEAGLRQHTLDFENFDFIKIHSNATGVFAGLNYHF